LHHIPIVGEIYRAVSGDKVSNGASLANRVGVGAAIAGPIGMAVGAGVFLVEKGIGSLVRGLFGGGAQKPAREEMAITQGVAQTPQQAAEPSQAAKPQRGLAAPQGPWPQLSPDQFGALMQSFQAPGAASASAAQANRSAPAEPPDTPKTPASPPPLATGADFVLRMQANLDRYQAMKAQDALQPAR
jgi:hypothetical protein